MFLVTLQVTVSTVGLVPEIRQFCETSTSQLAVSLHATTDEVRDWIAPVNRRWNLAQLMGTLRDKFPARQPLVADPPTGSCREPVGSYGEADMQSEATPRTVEAPGNDRGAPMSSSPSAALPAAILSSAAAVVPADAVSRDSTAEVSASAGAGAEDSTHVAMEGSGSSSSSSRRRFARFVLIEYVMLRGVNDTEADAFRCSPLQACSAMPPKGCRAHEGVPVVG